MQLQVRHSIPGRMRLHVPVLKLEPDFGELLVRFFQQQANVTHARANVACACVVIEFRGEITQFLKHLSTSRWRDLRSILARSSNQEISRRPPQAPETNGSLPYATASVLLSWIASPLVALLNISLIVWNAVPIWKRALHVLKHERRMNVDLLDGLATVIALSQGQIFTAAFMVWLISLGDWIRNQTAAKSKGAVANLLEYQGHTACVLRNGEFVRVPAMEIHPADVVMVRAGEMIPVDGHVEDGLTTVDQKMVTGESMPVLRENGDRVYAGTVVCEGEMRVIASRVGSDTTAAQIVSMIESAPVAETRVQNYAEKFADRLVAPWLAMSLGVFAATRNVDRLLSMAIIDYGTGIRVAAPTSILASMAAAARQGILIKGGRQMEKLAQADTMIFDKTGTLTRGLPHVVGVRSYQQRSFPGPKILEMAAALEATVKHPLAEAIVGKARQSRMKIPEVAESKYRIGMGVEARVNGYFVQLGSARFLRASGVKLNRAHGDLTSFDNRGCSTVVMAVNGELAGAVACADRVRTESRDVIRALHKHGIKNVMMVTGDTDITARAVSNQLGIDRVFAQTLPHEKVEIVSELQRQGRTVVMVGDGINDSPALAYADVGIAMRNGADAARETADVVLMEDNLWKLPSAVQISHNAMRLIRQNYAMIAGLNTLALLLCIPSGLVSAGTIAAISNGSTILASLNAIRPLLRLR